VHDRVFATTSAGKPLPSTGQQFYPVSMHDFAVKEDNGITPNKAAPPLPAVPPQPETAFVQDCLSTHLSDAERSAGWTENHYRWCLTGALHWQKVVVDSNGKDQVVAELVMAVTWSGYADPFARRFVIWAITGGIQFVTGESLFHDGDLFALAAQCSPGNSASCTAQTTPADMRTLAEIRDNPAVTVQTVLTDTSLNNYPLTGDKLASFNIIATWEAHDATGNGGAGQALFSVAQVDPLRLYIYVPQVYASQVKIGDTVRVSLAERAGEHYEGSIARTARAIDPATRTLQVEIRVPNPAGELFSGAYVQAELPIKGDHAATVVPTNVLLFRPDGPRVAVVDQSGRVRLAPVKLGTDYGTSVEVLAGLDAADQIIVNPADSLADGDVVTLVRTPQSTG